MKINIIYPAIKKKKLFINKLTKLLGVLFTIASIACVVINIILKGKPWSLLAVLGIIMVWKFVFARTLVEYNRMDQFVKLLLLSCLMLHFIDIFFSSGWGATVIPIVLFSGVFVTSILLFTDYETQKQNLFPAYLLLIFCLAISIVALASDYFTIKWVYIVLISVSTFYLFISTFIFKYNIFKELKKRFTIK